MANVDKCCCFSLRTSGIIIGWLGLIYAIGTLVKGVELLDDYDWMRPKSINQHTFKMIMKSIAHSQIVGSVIGILMNIGLLWGTYKNKRLMLIPWLVTYGVTLIILAVALAIFSVVLIVKESPIDGLILLLIGGFVMVVYTYLWYSIQKLYRQIAEEERMKLRRRDEETNLMVATAPCLIATDDSKPPPYNSLKI